MKNKKIIVLLVVFTIIFTVAGGTLAYWNWSTSESQKTNVVFTVASNFSCTADGGGNITSSDVSLAPASCTNSTYAIKRTVKVTPTITESGLNINMDLWLKVNSIGLGLAASQNFKYALTTSSSNCTTGVVAQGNFNGATTNTQKTLLHNKSYSQTKTDTYYLWIWLDAAETDSATQNQSFSIELGGACTDQAPVKQIIYTANLYDNTATNYNSVMVGSSAPNNITRYSTPEAAMAALKTAGGGTTDYPFFLKHTTESDTVTESYVGFVVTPAMANANPGMTAGTYYLRGGDDGRAYNDNKATLLSAFGSANCTDYSSNFSCSAWRVPGLNAFADSGDSVQVSGDAGSNCGVYADGSSRCVVNVGGGE